MKRSRLSVLSGCARRELWSFPRAALIFAFALGLLQTHPARAVILIGTDSPTANTTAPTGGLAGSGWDLQGTWGSFLGTPIAPNYFITAKHVGGSVGGVFTVGGTGYTTVAKFNSPDSDLTIWQVSGTFSSYAPIYTAFDEVGQGIVMFGRGTQRGTEVRVGGELKGWNWGTADGVKRWGQNTVAGVLDGGTGLGYLLAATFDQSVGGNEAIVSVGDSSGGVFIQDGGVWKLAGLNYGVVSEFRTGPTESVFNAAIFDAGGLYNKNGVLIPEGATDIPAYSLFTPMSDHQAWILSVVPEPGDYGLAAALLLGGWAVVRRRTRAPA
jgi:hypothetical protein